MLHVVDANDNVLVFDIHIVSIFVDSGSLFV